MSWAWNQLLHLQALNEKGDALSTPVSIETAKNRF